MQVIVWHCCINLLHFDLAFLIWLFDLALSIPHIYILNHTQCFKRVFRFSVLERIKEKTSTIVICTSNVSEVTEIADRMAILLAGKLHCYGTPSFLKT